MIDHFDFLAPFYEKFISPQEPKQLKELLELPVQGSILDVGGGTGRLAQFLVSSTTQVVVADLSFEMLQQAAQKPDLDPTCSQSEKLPFRDNHFERIIMVDALHHVYDQSQTAREVWRVLRPGGKLIIEEPDLRKGVVKLVALAEKLALMRSHFLSPPKIELLFDNFPSQIRTVVDGHNAWIIVEK